MNLITTILLPGARWKLIFQKCYGRAVVTTQNKPSKNSFSVQFIEKKEFPTVRIILSWCTNHEYFSENKWTCGLKFNVNLSGGRTVSGKQKFQSYSTA